MSVALPTREDYFQIGARDVFARAQLRQKATRLSPQAVFTPGTDINIIIAAASAMGDEATRHLGLRIAALYLDSAEGEDLDRLVADRFSPTVVRKQSAQAVVPLTFSRSIPPSSGTPITFDVGRKFKTQNGLQYELVESASFALNSSGPVTARAVASLSGEVGNVAEGAINQFVDAPGDATILVTNLEPAAGGVDVETDASLRERARAFFLAARRGILSAIEFGALTVPGIASAVGEELIGPDGFPNGYVRLYIADKNGQANTVLANAVRLALREYRGAGVPVAVVVSSPTFLNVAYQVGFQVGVDQQRAIQQLKTLTVNAMSVLAPNEALRSSMLMALARSVPGLIVPNTAIVNPLGDVFPDTGRTIRTTFDRVLVNGL
jgi:uncharacterized phage protein gp47/JayE